MNDAVTYFSKPSQLLIALYRLARWGLIATVTAVYFSCYQWHMVFGIIMLAAFADCFSGVARLIVNFIVYVFSKPVILKEVAGVREKGIPQDVKVVFFRPIFAKSNPEMDTVLSSMECDIQNAQEPHNNLKFIVIDNTRDEKVKEYTRSHIKRLQEKYGTDVVFYFHRNVECDFFKKVGIFQDALMFLYEGWTTPRHYIGSAWAQWTKGTRNPHTPLWDVIMGDVNALGIQGTVEDVLAGKEVMVNPRERVRFAFVSDADNIWPKGEVRKLVAKMMHEENKDITIFQPSIDLSNPDENSFIKLTSIAREMYGFDMIARWRIYRFNPFFGKGAMRISSYSEEVIKSEALHPGKAASHDFQEALRSWSVLVEDVCILEKTFSNKLSEFMRGALWQWGDLETVEQFLLMKCEAGRQQHLFVLLRNLIGTVVYNVWLLGTVLAWYVPVCADVVRGELLVLLFAVIVLIGVVVPKILSPLANRVITKAYQKGDEPQRSLANIAMLAVVETTIATLIHIQDLIYRPIALGQNIMKQITGKEYVWKTGAMGEIETAQASLANVYSMLRYSTIVGIVLLLLSVTTLLDPVMILFLSPYMLSFLLGPILIYVTVRPVPPLLKKLF